MTDENGLERYRIVSTLGRGGMATVLLAEDQRLGRMVALKQLADIDGVLGRGRGRESNETLLSRLRREALLGASVSHPNLVSIYDIVSTSENGLVIVMEYVPGETLRDRMARVGRLSPDAALPILEGIANGLDAIHRRGIVHRDLKPANVLLGDGGAVKLADFGIATGVESTRITSQGAVVGSFRYMAPEQLEDAPSSPAMDIYALAIVALEMLSGERARPESHPVALAHALATQPPPDLRTTWPQAPRAAAELLIRAMSRDPAGRPPRAGELIGRLRSALLDDTTHYPVGSRPVDEVDRGDDGRTAPVAVPPRVAPHVAPRPVAPQPAPAASATQLATGGATTTHDAGPPRGTPGVVAGRRRRRLAAPIALLAVLGAAAAAVIATSGSSGSSHDTRTKSASTGAHTKGLRSSSAGKASAAATGDSTSSSSSSTTTTTSATTSSPGSASAKAAHTPSTRTQPATLNSAATTPVQAVETFYHAAAAHQYASAWSLADGHFQQQLGGYASFQAGQADDRSITFSRATVTDMTSASATVAVRTTSERTDGTESCAGDVDLVKTGATWQLDQIGISCG